jgi:hypothetical protein
MDRVHGSPASLNQLLNAPVGIASKHDYVPTVDSGAAVAENEAAVPSVTGPHLSSPATSPLPCSSSGPLWPVHTASRIRPGAIVSGASFWPSKKTKPAPAQEENGQNSDVKRPPKQASRPQSTQAGGLRGRGTAYGADDEIRTRDPHLGKVMLYQLSYVRIGNQYRWTILN